MVLHYLPDRAASAPDSAPGSVTVTSRADHGPRAGFVVGRGVGNSVVRHRVTRRLRAVVRDELHRLPAAADLVVRARPEAAEAGSDRLRRDLVTGLDRLLADPVPSS